MSKQYKIKSSDSVIAIINMHTSELVAKYATSRQRRRADVAAWRRAIDKHIANGGTLCNYQW